MGLFDSFAELVAAAMPWETVEAEAPPEKSEEKDEGGDEESEGQEVSKESEDKEGEEEGEEEEEEELEDQKEKLEEECKESKQCSPAKHHFDECVERVTGADTGKADKKHPNEDCIEEFFHLAHCAGECAAPKLWAQLK